MTHAAVMDHVHIDLNPFSLVIEPFIVVSHFRILPGNG